MLQKAHLASLSAFANSAAKMKTNQTRLVKNQTSQRIATLFFSVALKNALARAFKIFWPVNLVTFVDLESEKK